MTKFQLPRNVVHSAIWQEWTLLLPLDEEMLECADEALE